MFFEDNIKNPINFTKWESIHKMKKHIIPRCLLEVQGDQYTELSNVWKHDVLWIALSKHQLLLGKLQPLRLQKSHDPNGSPKWLAYTKRKQLKNAKTVLMCKCFGWFMLVGLVGLVGIDFYSQPDLSPHLPCCQPLYGLDKLCWS